MFDTYEARGTARKLCEWNEVEGRDYVGRWDLSDSRGQTAKGFLGQSLDILCDMEIWWRVYRVDEWMILFQKGSFRI